ncbi:MAG: hypothetical protein U1F49_06520 [Rubrivivax sp.]
MRIAALHLAAHLQAEHARAGAARDHGCLREHLRRGLGVGIDVELGFGVVFPAPWLPPMMTRPASSEGSSGAFANASATLVSGPIASSVMRPGCARTQAIIASTPWPG